MAHPLYPRKLYPARILLCLAGLFSTLAMQAQHASADTSDIQISVTAEDSIAGTDMGSSVHYFLEKNSWKDADSLQLRQLPDSIVSRMKNDDDFWYVNAGKAKEKKNVQKKDDSVPLRDRTWFRTLLWLLIIGGFVGFLIWYLAGNHVSLFRKKSSDMAVAGEVDGPTDIFGVDYEYEINKAVSGADFRLAVRLQFLRLLKKLSDKEIIRYKQEKTNLDYLTELRTGNYYDSFFRVTRYYEYSWYGKFPVPEETYAFIKKEFDNIYLQLR